MKNIVLVGMMGSGKTTVAKALAQLNTQFEFIDIDAEIEKFQNIKISKIFEKYGERFFRELEDKFIKKFSMKSSKIIATGGGACENMENIENLQQKSVIFYLRADAQTLYTRLKNDKSRPKLQNENMQETLQNLLDKREKNYQLADFDIDVVDKTVENIANEIMEKYEQFCG